MNELADKRLSKLRTYSGPRDPEFRRATFQEILRRKHNHDPNHDRIMEVAITTLHCVFERVTDLAAILQDALSQGAQLSFDKLYTIACVLGCEKQRDNDGIPEFQAAKLLAAIEDVFEQKYEEVVKAAKEAESNPSLFTLTAARDVKGLRRMISELRFEAGFPDPVASKPKRAFSLFRRRNSDTGAEPEPEQRQPDTPGMKDPLLDKDEDGCTVLHLASMLHYDDCVAAILAAAAASPVPGTLAKLLEARDLSGNTALYYALNNEGIACVREFQKAGADFVGATIKHGGRWESAIEVLVYYAARAPAQNLACFKEVLEMLRVNPNFDINRTYDGRRSQRSSSAGDGDGVGDDQRPRGENPLFIPVNPMVGSEDEDGPFAYPMFGGDDDMVESDDGNPGNGRAHGNAQGADEDADSDVDEENDDDEDHIVDAEDMDAEELMEEAYRRMVMARFGDGRERKARSLLAVAASKGNIECVQLLLAAGATADGEALLTAVRMFPSRDVPARYRYRFDSDEDLDAFTSPEGAGYFACVDALLTAGADPNSTDSEGDSVLQFVAESGNLLMAKFLMQRGANVSAKNKEGITPAERARLCGNERLADWLGNQSRLRRLLSPPNSQGGSNNSRSFNRSKSTLDDVPREEACVVCWERRREVILAPCGHKVMCKRDTRRVMEGPEEKRFCPMCKEKIDSFVTTVYEHV